MNDSQTFFKWLAIILTGAVIVAVPVWYITANHYQAKIDNAPVKHDTTWLYGKSDTVRIIFHTSQPANTSSTGDAPITPPVILPIDTVKVDTLGTKLTEWGRGLKEILMGLELIPRRPDTLKITTEKIIVEPIPPIEEIKLFSWGMLAGSLITLILTILFLKR